MLNFFFFFPKCIIALEINPILAKASQSADNEVREAALILSNLNQGVAIEQATRPKKPQIVDAAVKDLIIYFKQSI